MGRVTRLGVHMTTDVVTPGLDLGICLGMPPESSEILRGNERLDVHGV